MNHILLIIFCTIYIELKELILHLKHMSIYVVKHNLMKGLHTQMYEMHLKCHYRDWTLKPSLNFNIHYIYVDSSIG